MPRPLEAYAVGTKRSRMDTLTTLEMELEQAGATRIARLRDAMRVTIAFEVNGRSYRVEVFLPAQNDPDLLVTAKKLARDAHTRVPTTPAQAFDLIADARFRALLAYVRAKLLAVATGISSLETEFVLHTILPDGRTAAEHVLPGIAQAYQTGRMIPLLPSPESE